MKRTFIRGISACIAILMTVFVYNNCGQGFDTSNQALSNPNQALQGAKAGGRLAFPPGAQILSSQSAPSTDSVVAVNPQADSQYFLGNSKMQVNAFHLGPDIFNQSFSQAQYQLLLSATALNATSIGADQTVRSLFKSLFKTHLKTRQNIRRVRGELAVLSSKQAIDRLGCPLASQITYSQIF